MSKVGRNDPCPCGSGRKAKRCCGIASGPSEEQLARAVLATLGDEAAFEFLGWSQAELQELWFALDELPALDLSLQVRLPDLVSAEVERLSRSIEDDEPDKEALAAVVELVDTPLERRRLANAAVALRDARRIDRDEAAAVVFDLSSPSTWFLEASVLAAVAVAAGLQETPGGLRVAA